MSNAFFDVPIAMNEPVKSYAPGSPEKASLKACLAQMKSEQVDLPMIIGGKEVRTNNQKTLHPPHEIGHSLGQCHIGDSSHVNMAIDAALKAKDEWANMSWEHRASIFLKAAELLAGPYRDRMNASTMLSQSKNAYQAEIDAACEMVDFFRYNVQYMTELYAEQPESGEGVWNRLEYRPLEGFVLAITPFNFTSICANLCAAPAMMGNTIVWKAANTQIYSAHVIMDLFKEAGMPDGVINIVHAPGPVIGEVCFAHPEFGGVHFTGSTATFKRMWKSMGENINNYKYYPRIVGETGGKDFILAHESSDTKALATAMVRGAFEYQGQKCSAASRAYIPSNIWNEVRNYVQKDLNSIKMGGVEDFTNFINAVIDEKSFDNIKGYIDRANVSDKAEVIMGGNCDKSEGYFVSPTVIQAKDPYYESMVEEIFGPVLTVYVYDPEKWDEVLEVVNNNDYALTGAIFSQDRYIIESASKALRNAAGNYYINDKPSGAVVGQQPFGGGRGSGTNDKAGAKLNLIRWASPRTIKETFVPAKDYRYPFLGES